MCLHMHTISVVSAEQKILAELLIDRCGCVNSKFCHIRLSISYIITTGRKVEAENLHWPPSYLTINIYEVIWIIWFCNYKISFGEGSKREKGGEECQQGEEEDSRVEGLMKETLFGIED